MENNLKELLVVLVIGTALFRFGRTLFSGLIPSADYTRRRNVWLILTVAGFLSPNFWIYCAVAIPLLLWATRRDANPVALYVLLLHVVPQVSVEIPGVGINSLFPADNYRLLSLCVLVPVVVRTRRAASAAAISRFSMVDVLLIAYGALQTALFIPPDLPNHQILQDSLTNVLRRGFLFLIDSYVLYYAASRTCTERRALAEVFASMCVAAAVLAGTALFEASRHWLLYIDIVTRWSLDPLRSFYTMRGSWLRAEASTGSPLCLGFILAIAFGQWQYLKRHVGSRLARAAFLTLILAGLLSAYSRGPWFGAVFIYFACAALAPGALSRMFKALGTVALLTGLLMLSPLGEQIMSVLPFMGGSIDRANFDYRTRLIGRSWELLQAHPFFGDQLAVSKLADLRQGMGIVDLVNTYVEVALNYGIVGLCLLLAFFVTCAARAYRFSREVMQRDRDLGTLGTSLVACLLGTLLMIENSSFILAYEKFYFLLAGLAVAYSSVSLAPLRTVGTTCPSGVGAAQR